MSATNCNFSKIVPSNDPGQCSSHTSIGNFTQGIFPVSPLSLDKMSTIQDFINKYKRIKGVTIECYLLKHSLIALPMETYYNLEIVHHAQIGFIFRDASGTIIRHLITQLQNSYNPATSSTAPFNLAAPCLVGDDIVLHFDDHTCIFADFLEPVDGVGQQILENNRNVYFRGIQLPYLEDTVTFDFFLESYRVWRALNTPGNKDLLKNNIEANLPSVRDQCGQKDKYCGGGGDGSLFVLNSFSPGVMSKNPGAILHFATLSGDNCVERLGNLMEWGFANFNCYDNFEQHTGGYSRHYVAMSTSTLNYTWCKSVLKTDTDSLFSTMRTDWLTNSAPWDDVDKACANFDILMKAIVDSPVLQQTPTTGDLTNTLVQAADPSVPLLCFGQSYDCEFWSRILITMILNTNNFRSNGVNVQPHFDFTFGNKAQAEMTSVENLYRCFAAYWPVACYSAGYENGVLESEFNANKAFTADRKLYASQSLIFSRLFNGKDITAANTTGNPVLMLLSEYLGAPFLSKIMKAVTGVSPMTKIFRVLMYILFVRDFLKCDEVFLSGYRLRRTDTAKPSDYTLQFNPTFDTEPCVYKFPIGNKSRAGMANDRLLEAVLEWITLPIQEGLESAESLAESTFDAAPAPSDSKQGPRERFAADIAAAKQEIEALRKGATQTDCSKYKPTKSSPFSSLDNMMVEMCESMNEMRQAAWEVKHATNAVTDVGSAFKELLEHPAEIIVPDGLVSELKTFLTSSGSKILNVLSSEAARLASWCHINYSSDEQVLYQRQTDSSSSTLYGMGNMSRPTGSAPPCTLLSEIGKKPQKYVNKPKLVKFRAPYPLKINSTVDDACKSRTGTIVTLVIVSVSIVLSLTLLGSMPDVYSSAVNPTTKPSKPEGIDQL